MDDKPLYLIDTPGFDDDKLDDNAILEMIWKDLKSVSSMKDRKMTGIIFLYDITQQRIGGTMLRVRLVTDPPLIYTSLTTTPVEHGRAPKSFGT